MWSDSGKRSYMVMVRTSFNGLGLEQDYLASYCMMVCLDLIMSRLLVYVYVGKVLLDHSEQEGDLDS